MNTTNPTTANTLLEISRELSAPPERVFAALTQPELMNQWFYGNTESSAQVESDFRVRGQYTVYMRNADGDLATCGPDNEAGCAPHGEYLEIDPPRKLVFTWVSEGFVEHSVVTIELSPIERGTLLNLRHELPAAVAPAHREGWNACLNHLAATF